MNNVLELRGVSKYFGDFCANDHIDFDLREGEIHALLGENGAGKSTLMNVLYGMISNDGGDIIVNGEKVTINNPSEAMALGIGMVHQHFALIPQLTVTQNIYMGMKEAGFVLNMRELDKKVAEANERYGFNVDPKAPIWQLPVGVQQKVEILKALVRRAKILILDEPTAVLTVQEIEELFQSLKKLVKDGCSIILITHKIDDVMTYCDRVTVLRNGKVTGVLDTAEMNREDPVRLMVGRNVDLDRKIEGADYGKVMFSVKDLCVKNDKGLLAVNHVSFDIRAGEVVGVAGVDGNGQLEMGEAITGLRKYTGTVSLQDGVEHTAIKPIDLISKGVAHIPDDRHKKGLVLPFTLTENLVLGSQRKERFTNGIFVKRKEVEEYADELIERFDIRPPVKERTAGTLSGGNQQKVILARELSRHPEILIAIQPTRGLDIGATEFMWNEIARERNEGKAVLLISTDLDEIYALSDSIVVMQGGVMTEKLPPDIDVEELGLLMSGKKQADETEAEVK